METELGTKQESGDYVTNEELENKKYLTEEKAAEIYQPIGNYATKTELSSGLAGKANTEHTHEIADVTDLQSALDAKVPTSRTVNGKALSADITLTAADVNADAKGSATSALNSAKSYADGLWIWAEFE